MRLNILLIVINYFVSCIHKANTRSMKSTTTKSDKEFIYRRAWAMYQQGSTLRQLAAHFGISRGALEYNFKSRYGKDYAQVKTPNGTLLIIDEAVNTLKLSERQRQEIHQWKVNNIERIISVDQAQKGTRLLTSKQEQALTYAECSRGKNDYRQLFDTYLYP